MVDKSKKLTNSTVIHMWINCVCCVLLFHIIHNCYFLFRGTTPHLFKCLGIDLLSNYSLKDRLQSANFQFIQYGFISHYWFLISFSKFSTSCLNVGSDLISFAIFSWAWITVVWSRPPNSSPILGNEKSVNSLDRYIAICRG